MTHLANRAFVLAVVALAAGFVAVLVGPTERGSNLQGSGSPVGATDVASRGELATPLLAREPRNAHTSSPDTIAGLVAILARPGPDAAAVPPSETIDALVSLGASSVGALCAALRSSSGDATARVLVCLGRLGIAATPATDDVAAFLRSSRDDDLRGLAARTLATFGPDAVGALADLRALLSDVTADRPARFEAARAMAAVAGGTDAFVDACLAALADRRGVVRLAMLSALEDDVPAVHPVRRRLLALLDDEEPEVRRAAATVIGRLGPAGDDAVRAIAHALDTDPPSESNALARALARLGPDGIAELVAIAASGHTPEVRLASIRAADGVGFAVRDRLDLLATLLDSPQVGAGWKARALELLAILQPSARAVDALPVLRRLTPDAGVAVRLAALRAAATLRGDDAAVADYLLDALGDGDDASTVAAGLLGGLPTEAERSVPALLDALVARPRARAAVCSALRALVGAAPDMRAAVSTAGARADADVGPWIAEALGEATSEAR